MSVSLVYWNRYVCAIIITYLMCQAMSTCDLVYWDMHIAYLMCQAMSACDCMSHLLRLCRLRVCKSGVLDYMRVLSLYSLSDHQMCQAIMSACDCISLTCSGYI